MRRQTAAKASMMVYAYNPALKSLRHFRAMAGDQYLKVVWDEPGRVSVEMKVGVKAVTREGAVRSLAEKQFRDL